MGRSVSILSDCSEVTYIGVGLEDEENEYWFQDLKEDVVQVLQSRFPSLQTCSRWDDNEVRIFLENHLVEIGISSYGYLVSISTRTKDYRAFGELFARRVDDCLGKNFKTLLLTGRASNGEAFFRYA